MLQPSNRRFLATVQACFALMKSHYCIAYQKRFSLTMPYLFFILVVLLFPLTISTETVLLARLAVGIIWIAAALAILLNATYLFYEEMQMGSLETLLLSPHPLPWLIAAELFAHWSTGVLPLIVLAPFLGVGLGLSTHAAFLLMVSLLLGTPVLSLLSAVGAALTLGLPQAGVLLAVLMLPLYVPVFIFGVHAALWFLVALLILALGLLPLAIAAALRLAVATV